MQPQPRLQQPPAIPTKTAPSLNATAHQHLINTPSNHSSTTDQHSQKPLINTLLLTSAALLHASAPSGAWKLCISTALYHLSSLTLSTLYLFPLPHSSLLSLVLTQPSLSHSPAPRCFDPVSLSSGRLQYETLMSV